MKSNHSKARAKGLQYVREFKAILEAEGAKVEGPGYKQVFIPDRTRGEGFSGKPLMIRSIVHADYFGLWDLISWEEGYAGGYRFWQVTTIEGKASHVKAILKSGMYGLLACRDSQAGRVCYRIFTVYPNSNKQVEESSEIKILKAYKKEKPSEGEG